MILSGLGVLLWKHGRVRLRRWILGLLEIGVALGPLILLVALGLRLAARPRPLNPYLSPPLPVEVMWKDSYPSVLLWAPNIPFLNDVVQKAAKRLNLKDDALLGFESEEVLIQKKKNLTEYKTLAIIFQNASKDSDPESFEYRIRSPKFYDTSRVSPEVNFPGPHEQYAQRYEVFVALQTAIDVSYIETKSGNKINKSLSFQQFPYPPFEHDEIFWLRFSMLLPVASVLGLLPALVTTVARLVAEKISGIKELMKMMGMSSNLLWVSHYVNCILPHIGVLAVQLGLLKLGSSPLVPHTNTFILAVSLFLYTNYMIFFAFLLSTLFTRVLMACVITSLVWVTTLAVAMTPGLRHSLLSTLGLSCLPNMPIFWMYQLMGVQEMDGSGLGWGTLLTHPSDSCLSLGLVWLLTVLHCVLYALLAWYVEQVNPGPIGVARPLGFLFQRSFWSTQQVAPEEYEPEDALNEEQDPAYFESPAKNAKVGIDIKNMWKVYGGWGDVRHTALAGVNMQILDGGITVLLGHNGAGKTTLMSIITGMQQATRGTIRLGQVGHLSMGLCPQDNLTFPDLTLKEHLIFFGLIKGLSYKEAVTEGADVLERIQLVEKGDWLCAALSGGQRRRAQLALALVGRPKLLILDEPTTGLDPHSRRQLWDILLEIREKHTILITTHFMEEADVLGDRVAILDHGQLRCYGTSMFLKKAFGTGYTLNIVLQDSSSEEQEAAVGRLVRRHVDASGSAGRAGCLRWRLPPGSPPTALPALFRALELEKKNLGIASMGLALTTLEEVFLRVTEGTADEPLHPAEGLLLDPQEGKTDDSAEYLTGGALLLSQAGALLTRKCLYFMSVKASLTFQVALSCSMFLLPLLTFQGGPELGVWPPLRLAPPPYPGALLLPYSTNGSAPPPALARLGALFNMTLNNTGSDVYQAILDLGWQHPERGYPGPTLLALSLFPGEYRALYSTSVYHGLPSAAGLLANLLALEAGLPPVRAQAHPWPPNPAARIHEKYEGKSFTDIIFWSCCVVAGCNSFVALILPLSTSQRTSGSAPLLGTGGAAPLLRLFCFAAPDLLLLFVAAGLLTLATGVLDPELRDARVPLLALLWSHLPAALTVVYVVTLVVRHPAGGYITILVITIIFGLLMPMWVFTTGQMEDNSLGATSGALRGAVALLVPPYPLCHGLLSLGFLSRENTQCLEYSSRHNRTKLCCSKDEVSGNCTGLLDYYSHKQYGISSHIMYMVAGTIFYAAILVLYEYHVWQRVWEAWNGLGFNYPELALGDQDVDKERKAVQDEVDSGNKGQSCVLMCRLAKRYRTGLLRRSHVAVKDLSLSIKEGECLGLLGANGAGKSTTFGMLVGNLIPTRGTVYRPPVGYCPQFDALDSFLTGSQVLQMFCLLRGHRRSQVAANVNTMLCSAGLKEHGAVMCRKYSGGQRRKLSALVALLGRGAVLLDEPSAGVDPRARRSLHQLLRGARLAGRSVLLSSHSMEECEQLVSRLAILSGGELSCLGPVQTLKERYGAGFLLSLRIRTHPLPSAYDTVDSRTDLIPMASLDCAENLVNRLKTSIHAAFPCQLKDQHLTILQYHISDKECQYSELFSRMEEIRDRNGDILEDYTISNTTLEQVFLSLSSGAAKTNTNSVTV